MEMTRYKPLRIQCISNVELLIDFVGKEDPEDLKERLKFMGFLAGKTGRDKMCWRRAAWDLPRVNHVESSLDNDKCVIVEGKSSVKRLGPWDDDYTLERLLSEIHSVSRQNYHRTKRFSTFSGDPLPGKGQVCDQWAFEVKSTQDHYPKPILREGSVRSLKGVIADLVTYLGPTANFNQILAILVYDCGIVAYFDVLMQSF